LFLKNRTLKFAPGITMTKMVFLGLLAWTSLSLAAASTASPDYALLDEVLLYNVRNGYVDYDGIRTSPKFERFVEQLAARPAPFATPAAELAYYINAYNALAIRGVLDGFAPEGRFGRWRYFRHLKFAVAGEQLSLDEIEHRRLQPLSDARFHFAVVGAAMSGPRLSNRAYLPETLEAQLDESAHRFVNDITRNRFDVALKTAFLSPIFDVSREDFERSAGSVTAFLLPYIEEPAERAALREGRLAIRYLPSDRELNGSLRAKSRSP
jgi:Protein of unknown function, DUF547